MTSPYRALCAELLNGLDELAHPRYPFPGYTRCAMDRARTLLAQPVAEGPTDAELWEMYDQMCGEPGDWAWVRDYARAVLARWGRPKPQPVELAPLDKLDRLIALDRDDPTPEATND